MLNMSYNAVMPKPVSPESRKDCQVGFRVTKAQKERLDLLVNRVIAQDKRVKAVEVYEELMSLRDPEFVTQEDRLFLLGRRPVLKPQPAKKRIKDEEPASSA